MWDLRKIGKGVKALASASQNNTILSAYWAPDGAPTLAFFSPSSSTSCMSCLQF